MAQTVDVHYGRPETQRADKLWPSRNTTRVGDRRPRVTTLCWTARRQQLRTIRAELNRGGRGDLGSENIIALTNLSYVFFFHEIPHNSSEIINNGN